jgi:flavorubredoxin
LLETETVDAYPTDYNSILLQTQNELNSGYHPPLQTVVYNIGKYAMIFVGHPIWPGHMPPPIQSFLASYDLSGKKIAPFCTHGGSEVAQSRSDLSRLCPNSIILESLAISGSSVNNSPSSITSWIERIGY